MGCVGKEFGHPKWVAGRKGREGRREGSFLF
jgi:hypothetical protein